MAASFTLKKIPDDLYEKVRARAERNHRSVNGEIIAILDSATSLKRTSSDEIIARARAVRARTRAFLTEEFLNRAKREGLP